MQLTEQQLLLSLQEDNTQVFETLYTTYFRGLHVYVLSMIKDEMEAEEIVQQVFVKIWEKRKSISIQSSIKAYLYKAVYHESLNWIKHQKVKAAYASHRTYVMKNSPTPQANETLAQKTLEQKIREALLELPEQCRTIFQLSRFEELKYREIAAQLQISEKTVENQMGKALKLMRIKLSDYLTTLFFIFTYLQLLLP